VQLLAPPIEIDAEKRSYGRCPDRASAAITVTAGSRHLVLAAGTERTATVRLNAPC
jgi:hypothetical protein